MGIATSGRNLLVDGLAGGVSHFGVADGVPSDAGSNEVGSTTRQAVTWTAAAGGVRDNVGSAAFSMPANSGATHGMLWSALSAGTFRGSAPINGSRGVGTVDAADVTANTITSPAHGLTNTMRVQVIPMFAGSVPAGLSSATEYFVVGSTTDTFQVSLTSGGAAVDITGTGRIYWEQWTRESGASAWTLTFNAGAIDLDCNVV
jgi:hypothetical protein